VAASKKSDLPEDRRAPGKPDDPDAPTPAEGADVGEYLSVGDDDDEIQMGPDDEHGGSVVYLEKPEEAQDREEGGFYENLAEILDDTVMDMVATDLLRKIEEDKEARKKRDEQYEEGIRRTGLGKDAPGGADFEGASRVVHPMLTEACIDYESRVIKELMPPSGPVKPKILGVPTKEKTQRAARKVEHMNYQITTQIKEAFSVLETTLTQVPLGGVQYIKQWWDHRLMRPRWQFVAVDNIYLPFGAADFASASRRTFKEDVSAVEFQQRVEQGLYRDIKVPAPSQVPDRSKAAKANEKVEGVDDQGQNLDGEREIYEVMSYIEITDRMGEVLQHEEEGMLYPYLISIDVTSKKVLSWYRDWEEEDHTREPIEHLFEFPFIPWRGAYSIGLPQIIGGLSAAATGALRALLDSAHINNAPSGLIKKGSSTSGKSYRPEIGTLTEIDAGLEADDIRKVVMPFPFNGPAPVLFQLLGFLVDASKGTVRTSMDEEAINTNANTPVGTQLSRVEEGLVVFSSIHGRIHKAFNRLLAGLHRLNKLYLPDEPLRVDQAGQEILISRKDYEGVCDIQPVSDPTIYSDQQRMWQITAIQQRAAMSPGLYNLRKVEERFLKLMKVDDPDELLVAQPEPHELNAVNECLAMSLGQPIKVFPEQNHLAHLQVHVEFMSSPMLGMNPIIAPKYLPAALQHIAEHIVMLYVSQTVETIKGATNGTDPTELMSNDPQVKKKFDELLAAASEPVIGEITQHVAKIQPAIQQAMQMLQALAPKPPIDPGVEAATQASMAETQRKSTADQTNAQLESARLTLAQQTAQAKNVADQQRNAALFQRNQIAQDSATMNAQVKLAVANQDTETARDIATAKLTEGAHTSLKDGASFAQP
jgi:chaperonin GroES